MRQVVVQPDVHALRVDPGQKVVGTRRQTEKLLASDDGLHILEHRSESLRLFKSICGLEPVTVPLRRVCVFYLQVDRSLRRLPRDIRTVRVDMLVLQKTLIRHSNFKTRLRKENSRASSKRASRFKIFHIAERREENCIVQQPGWPRSYDSPQHSSIA